MSSVVRLRSSARVVRRAPGEVQVGLSPGHGIVLAGLSESETRLLLSLAGRAGTAHDLALARRFTVAPDRVAELVAALTHHGLLEGPTEHLPLPPRTVTVPGRGAVVDAVVEHLRAVSDLRLLVGHDAEASPDPDLAVLCAADAVAPDVALAWRDAGTTHLPVVLRDGVLVLGPLVAPGRSPCLRCLDLTRRDRDRAWPSILTQITSPTVDLASPVDAPQAQAAAIGGLVAMLVLECLTRISDPGGRPANPGLSWEISLPWPEVRQRRWIAHPECGCTPPDGT